MKKIMKQFSILVILVVSALTGCSYQPTQSIHNNSSNSVNAAATNTSVAPSQQVNSTNLANLSYDGKNQIITLNNNHTTFSKEDLSLSKGNWQTFTNLDQNNRVGVANAMLSKSMMPTAKREPLYVKPTGWRNKQIIVNGKREWLYNRCHLIGYQFTGENNNPQNLMTGTRSFNDPAMLKYEDEVATYLRTTGNHVRYQVEPIFKDNELVARGVHMQAKSVEDSRLEFNVYIFNVEPGVTINYLDGSSKVQ